MDDKAAGQIIEDLLLLIKVHNFEKLDTMQRGLLLHAAALINLREDYCVRALGMKPGDAMKAPH